MKRIEKNFALPAEREEITDDTIHEPREAARVTAKRSALGNQGNLIVFPSPSGAPDLTDTRLRTLLAAQVACRAVISSAYLDLEAGARYIGTSLRLAEDGSGVVMPPQAIDRRSSRK